MRSLRKMIIELKEFCKDKKKIYIYGTGKDGQSCKKVLDYLKIPVEAFLVTDLSMVSDKKKFEETFGTSILEWEFADDEQKFIGGDNCSCQSNLAF